MAIRILLVDDHALIRDGLRAVFADEADFQIVGETGDGLEVVSLVECLQPDILLLDLMLPGLSGLEITRQIKQRVPHTRIVILSANMNEAYVSEALLSGALAYVPKNSPYGELLKAIRSAMNGQLYLSPPLSEESIETFRHMTRNNGHDKYKTLTPRERQVLHLVAEGVTNHEMGARLKISPRTVEMHRANLTRKLGLRSTAELVRYALKRGITPPE